MKDYDVINPFGPMIYRADLTEDFHNFLLEGLVETKNENGSHMKIFFLSQTTVISIFWFI